MLLELQGATHRIKFVHHNPAMKRYRDVPQEGVAFGTEAVLQKTEPTSESNPEGWVNLSVGFSVLHENDMKRYDRETGRKIALARALLSAYPGEGNKTTRKTAWELYLNRPRCYEKKAEEAPNAEVG